MIFSPLVIILKTFQFNLAFALSCISLNAPVRVFFHKSVHSLLNLSNHVYMRSLHYGKKYRWAENTEHLGWSLEISTEIICSNKRAIQPVWFPSSSRLCCLLQAKCELTFSWYVFMWKCNFLVKWKCLYFEQRNHYRAALHLTNSL